METSIDISVNAEEFVENCEKHTKNKGVKLKFENEGIIADISVKVDYDNNVPSLAFKIQQSIKHNVEAMTNYKVLKVNVHIQDVNFPENSAL